MKLNFKSGNKLFTKNSGKAVVAFLSDKVKPLVFALFLALAGYCFYTWYQYVYNPSWSNEKKDVYRKSVDKEITFDKKNFQSVLDRVNARKDKYQQNIDNVNDIFRLNN